MNFRFPQSLWKFREISILGYTVQGKELRKTDLTDQK